MKKFTPLFLGFSLIFSACSLFENDVADFMEKYTETAAIEQHSFNVETYKDASNQICIASDEDAEITLLMRNPKQFSMVPSVEFNNLASNYSRSVVSIDQEDSFTVKLSLPQEFLIPVDEGKDITALINLHEPMSGRDFDRYTVNLSCNTKPPLILNPTVMNKGNQVFVVAFDMPNEEEVAVRHKDLAAVEINGVSYPVSVTTSAPDVIDPETPDLRIAHYTFSDPHFKRANPGYSELGGKTFDHNANNSVYFESDDPFVNGDKEYTIILRDKAGLTSEVKASTSISKLKKPVIKDQNGYEISEYDITVGGYNGIPYNEDTERGVITIYPPTEDHLNHAVSGATVYYRVYEATGSGRIYTSGSTTTAKTLELPQNTYRVEAYASLTNYENSSTTTVKFRFMNNVLYVRACTDTEGFIGDGSALAPYATFEEAIADINDEENRPDIADKFTIYIEGNFTDESVYAYMVDGDSDPTTPPVKQADPAAIHGDIILNGTIRTNELVIKKMPTASTGKLKSITIDSTVSLTKVTVGDVTITNNESNKAGILQNAENTLIIDGTIITGCNTGDGSSAIVQNTGSLLIKNCNISNNSAGLRVNEGSSCDIQGGLFESNSLVAVYLAGSGAYSISGGTFKNNSSSSTSQTAIWLALTDTATCTITGGSITQNNKCGIIAHSGILKLYGGEITNNLDCGIQVDASATLKVKGKPVVNNNTKDSEVNTITANIQIITAGKTITIDGPLTSGAKIGVTTATSNEPTEIGATYTIATGYTNSGSPSQYFTSDRGFSIVAGSGDVVNIAKSGSSGTQYLATDYNFEFAANSALAVPNKTKAMTITPTITRTEPGSTPATELWLGSDKKLYLANDHSIPAGSDTATVSWSIKIMNGGTQVGTPFTSNSFTFPALPEGSYKLVVTATYLGEPHSAEIDVPVNNSAENVAAYISSLTAAGTYPVVVEGPVGPGYTPGSEEGLALVATAIGNLGSSSNIYIEIDATNVTPTAEATAYNGGQYFYGKTQLKKILLPDWMLGIIQNMFFNCWNLEEVLIPDTVVYIEEGAFKNCSKLSTVNLPTTLTEIDADAFAGCTHLTTINFAGTKAEWAQIERASGWHTSVPATTLVHCAGGETCPLDYKIISTMSGINVTGCDAITAVEGSRVFLAGRNFGVRNLWVSDHETTQSEYVAVIGENPSHFTDNPAAGETQDNRPVENVNWFDCVIYCNRLSIMQGYTPCYTLAGSTNPDDWITAEHPVPARYDSASMNYWIEMECDFNADGYRLPTNIEWEYFARNGNLTGTPTRWPETDDETLAENYVWCQQNSDSKTHEVKKKLPNSLGLFDICGNVSEFVWDWDNGGINSSTPEFGTTNKGYTDSRYKGARGGSHADTKNDTVHPTYYDAQIFKINGVNPGTRDEEYGFRMVRTLP